jgi:hypothetical protein
METEQKAETKKSGFGMKILLGLMVLMVGSLAFAGVVSYLSNSVQVNVNVQNPMEMSITSDTGTVTENTLNFGSVYGGETIGYSTTAINKSNVAVSTYHQVMDITNLGGVEFAGTEFSSIMYNDNVGTPTPVNVLGNLFYVASDGVTLKNFSSIGTAHISSARLYFVNTVAPGTAEVAISSLTKDSIPAAAVIKNDINVTLASTTVGTYSLKTGYAATITSAIQ